MVRMTLVPEGELSSTSGTGVSVNTVLADLLHACSLGDEAAFAELYDATAARLFGLVLRTVRDRAQAEEVTQDAFIRAHRGLVNFRGDSAFSTWLYQIATNLARNRYWYWWRRKRDKSVSFDAPVSADNSTTLADLIPAEVETPDDITVTQEFIDRIAQGMEKLSAKHREILTLRNIKNLSYEEIADILGISVGTVKSRIARARESLRSKLGEDFKT